MPRSPLVRPGRSLLRPTLIGLVLALVSLIGLTGGAGAQPAADQHLITATAVDKAGNPIPDVYFVPAYRLPDGTWQGAEAGPILTDAQGHRTWNTPVGRTYRFCLFDDYYGESRVAPDRAVRYTNKCWRKGKTIAQATDIPVTDSTPLNQTFTVVMSAAGSAMSPTDPFVYGPALVGSTLRVDTGRYVQPAGVKFSYAWTYYDPQARVVVTIPGATKSSYTPTTADAGRSLSAVVTGKAKGYKAAPMQAYAGTVGQTVRTASAPLSVAGTGTVGQALTAQHGTVQPAPSGVEYTWLVDGLIRQQGDSATYVPAAGDAGKTVTLRYLAYGSGDYAELHDFAVGPVVHS